MHDAVLAQQPLNALLEANEVRTGRAQLKREFKARTTDPVKVLMALPRACEKVPAADFLTWVPKIGRHRAKMLCIEAGLVHPDLELRRLGSRARLELAEALDAAIARQK